MNTRLGAALLFSLVLSSAWSGPADSSGEVSAELNRAERAEKTEKWAGALQIYEDLYDGRVLDEETRARLRAKFGELRPRVAPNEDPERAGCWKVRAFAFRTLDFEWTDAKGTAHHARYRFRDDELESLRTAMEGFAERVWRHSSGELRILWDLEVIEEPLTRLEGDQTFWPGPSTCMPFFTDLEPGSVDSIFVYAKIRTDGGEDELATDVPLSLLAGTHGVLGDTKGATYIGFNSGGGWCLEPSGEVQWHEWLHAAQWALESRQGYPGGLIASSDSGHLEGEPRGDPCYARRPSEPNWMGFYEHIMEQHVTRRMWRELSVVNPPDNVFWNSYCREYLLLGPFHVTDLPLGTLEKDLLEAPGARPRAGREAGGQRWTKVSSADRALDLIEHLGARPASFAYVAVNVRSKRRQEATVRVGSDDGCKLWHAGRLVLDSPEPRGLTPDQDAAAVELARGDNWFLLKVMNVGGGWAVTFRVTDALGEPLSTIDYRTGG